MQTITSESQTFTPSVLQKSTSRVERRLFSRWKDGQHPVLVWTTENFGTIYEFSGPAGRTFHQTSGDLLRTITGKVSTPSFGRYFKLDAVESLGLRPSVFRILPRLVALPATSGTLRTGKAVFDTPPKVSNAPNLTFGGTKGSLNLTRGADEVLVRSLVETLDGFHDTFVAPKLGVDLVNRSHEVRKLLFAGFRGHMLAKGYDPEEVLQEIYKGLLTRNNGTCPWDEQKSTFGYYVTMVCRCVLTNYHRKMTKKQDHQYVELDEGILGAARSVKTHESTPEMAQASLRAWLMDPEHEGGTADATTAVRILPLVEEGRTRKEILMLTGLKENTVAKGLAHLRKWSKAWADEVGITVRERKARTTAH